MSDRTPPPDSDTGDEPQTGPTRRRSLPRRILGWIGSGGLNLAIAITIVVLVGLFAIRTALGQSLVVRGGVALVDGMVAGAIHVGDVRSANLLRGARLLDITLTTPAGDTLLTADSLEVDYRIRELLRGRIVLSDLRGWGADARLVQGGTAEEPGPSTLESFLGPSDSTAAESEGGAGLVLDGIHLDETRFRLRRPIAVATDSPLRTESRGEVEDLALDADFRTIRLGRVEILPEGRGGITIELDEADGTVRVVDEPIEIAEASAELRVARSRIIADVRYLSTGVARASGTVAVGLGGAPDVQLQLDVVDARLAELAWVSPEIPPLEGAFALRGRVTADGTRWTVSDGDLTWAGGSVGGGGTLETGPSTRLRDVRLTFGGVGRDAFDRWMPGELRVPGTVTGSLDLSGRLDSLLLRADVGLRRDGRRTAGVVRGSILLPGSGPVLAGMRVELNTVAWEMIRSVVPGFTLSGNGALVATVSGSVDEGLNFDVDARHEREGWPASHLRVAGTARRADTGWLVDVSGDAAPLSLGTLRQDWPDLPVEGALAGSFRAVGPVNDLRVDTDLTGDFGRARLSVRLDPAAPARGVRVAGDLIDFEAGRFLTAVGPRTRVTAEVDVEGSGSDLATLRGEGRLRFASSRIQGVDIDSAVVAGRIENSEMQIDSLRGRIGGFDLFGRGSLAVDSMRPAGEVRLSFSSESLAALRPTFLGDTVIARDTLQALEREVLVLNGIDPDTLPLAAEVRLDGRMTGEVVVRGSLTNFDADGNVSVRQLVRGYDYVESAQVDFVARGLPARDAAVEFTLEADSSRVFDRELSRTRVEGSYRHPSGDVRASLVQQGREELDVDTEFTLEDGGVRAALRTLELRVDSTRYALQRPSDVVWTDSIRSVRDFELLLEGPEPVRIRADGTLPYRGEADFQLEVDRLRISRLLRVLQREDLDVEGVVDADLRITGIASAPVIEGTVRADSVVALAARFDGVGGQVSYRDLGADLELTATRDGSEVLEVRGRVPVNLALSPDVERTVDEPMDLRVATRELPARGLIGWLQDLEDIEGTVTGDFRVTGTIDDPDASGDLRLRGGAWTLGSVGVRQSQVEGTLRIGSDGRVVVDASARAGGTAAVTGTIQLTTLSDPGFDLEIALDGFRAVDRLDVAGSVSGALTLTGRFRRPVLGGELEVDEGTLFLDEFQRNIGVLDLSDPRFTSIVDTTDIGGRSLLNRTQNPFMDALTVDILMDVERNTWLRGRDLQVEIQGRDIIVVYDRQQRDLALDGVFTVVRGQYFFGSRAFEVEGGTVSFLGTPGINPAMDITASTRVRRRDGDPLDISVNIGGTLLNPSVQPSTDEQGLSESDLYSYIVFGQPTSSLTSGVVGSGAGAGTAVAGAVGSWLSGSVANQLAALASQELSLIDYLAISQVGDFGLSNGLGGGGVGSSFASTQVEVGRYFSNGEIFGALVLRPLTQLGTGGSVIGGARMEWQSSDLYSLEAFVEDRFLRGSSFGLRELAADTEYIIGFTLVREWGY